MRQQSLTSCLPSKQALLDASSGDGFADLERVLDRLPPTHGGKGVVAVAFVDHRAASRPTLEG